MKKKVSRKPLVGLVGLIFGALLLSGCATPFPQNLMVAADPDNPLQGTWRAMASDREILVIDGNTATIYHNVPAGGAGAFFHQTEWRRVAVHPVEERNGVQFIHTWATSIGANGFLTVGDSVYERQVR